MAGQLGATTSRLLNRLQHDVANVAATGTTLATGDLILTADISDDYQVNASTPGEILAGAGITATVAEINGGVDLSVRTTVVPAGGAAVVLPSGGGTVLIPLVTANVTCTLPATPTAGLRYDFIFIGSAADAEDWVLTAAAFFAGGVCWLEEDSAGVEVASIYANGTTHNTLTINNPAAGTVVTCIGTGTLWGLTAMVVAADTPAFTAV